jgi:hypothetical protein
MSQIIKENSGGGGGGSNVQTITPNSGGAVSAVSNNINDQGLAANPGGNAFPMFSYNGGNPNVQWENRTYLSAYVVDPSTTNGSKGTFTTLASAITQAISDGATGDGVTIFVRDVTINETITVATNGVSITISGPSGINSQNEGASNPIFSGSFTNSGNNMIAFTGFNITGTIINSGAGLLYLNNSVISGTIENSSSGGIQLTNCFGSEETVNASAGGIVFTGCSLSGSLNLSNNASIGMFYSIDSGVWTGSTSVGIDVNNCYLPIASNSMTGGFIRLHNTGFGPFNFYSNTNVTYRLAESSQGNILQCIRPSSDYTVLQTDYYIGMISTSSPRNVLLPSSLAIKNQSFIIKDESGGAGTNNISLTVAGGTKTIDGLTSYPININFGSVTVIYDGTNYFTM